MNISTLPLTQNNVITTYGKDLGYQGSYVNYYISNDKVLVPTYNDPHDEIAIAMIQKLYPTRKAVGIDVKNLYAWRYDSLCDSTATKVITPKPQY